MKAGSIGDLDIFLGAKVKPMKMNNGVTAWAISPSKYVNEAINTCKKWIQEKSPHEGKTEYDHKMNIYSTRSLQSHWVPWGNIYLASQMHLACFSKHIKEKPTYYHIHIGLYAPFNSNKHSSLSHATKTWDQPSSNTMITLKSP